MKISRIITNRNFAHPPFWQIVHEWEDQMQEYFQIPYYDVDIDLVITKKPGLIIRLLNKVGLHRVRKTVNNFSSSLTLAYSMIVPNKFSFYSLPKTVTIVIDVWGKDLNHFAHVFEDSKLVFISSLVAFNKIKNINPRIQMEFLPISIPDKYRLASIPEKDIDIISFGRQSQKLHRYALQYIKENPTVKYIFSYYDEGKVKFLMNGIKDFCGSVESRAEFMELIRRSNVSLVSAPGFDDEKETGGVFPVTPRYLECAINYTHMIGLYPNNEEYNFYKINQVCPSVNSYEEFKIHLDKMLSEKFDSKDVFDDFVAPHLSSCRNRQIQSTIEKYFNQTTH